MWRISLDKDQRVVLGLESHSEPGVHHSQDSLLLSIRLLNYGFFCLMAEVGSKSISFFSSA